MKKYSIMLLTKKYIIRLLLFEEVQHNFLTKKYNSDVEVQVYWLTALTIRQSSHYRGRKG